MVFISRFGLYKVTVLLFGLQNAPSTFKHLMNHVFSDIIYCYILVYLDNVLVYSQTTENHEKHLREVFLQLYVHKLEAKYTEYK